MRTESILRPSILPVVFLCVCFAFTARADLLTTSEGQSIDGQFLGFADGSFRFQAGERVTLYPADQVKSVNLSPTGESALTQTMLQNMTQALNTIQQRLDQLQYQVNQLAAAQNAQMRDVQQRVFELNPLSRVIVEQQKGEFVRGGGFRVTGFLRNNAGITINRPMVRVDLLRADGVVVDSRTAPMTISALGPRERASFRVEIPSPPDFESYQVIPDLDYSSDPGARGGTYPPLRLERRD